MKKNFLMIAMLALTACGGGGGPEGGSPGSPPTSQGKPASAVLQEPTSVVTVPCYVILYGDSIMHGEPLILQGPRRRMQAARPSWTFDLRAVPGQTGNQGAQLAMTDPRPVPAVVVMQWGMNDAIQRTGVAPMRALIDQVRAEGSRPVLTGPSPYGGDIPRWLAVSAAIQAMAADTATPWVNWGAAPIQTLDGVHPDQASSNRLVDALIAVLDEECAKPSRD